MNKTLNQKIILILILVKLVILLRKKNFLRIKKRKKIIKEIIELKIMKGEIKDIIIQIKNM